MGKAVRKPKMERPWPASKVEFRNVDDLVPSARNARLHSETQVTAIAASMQRFGWTIPLLVDENDEIIAGHGRILSAKRLGYKSAPVMVAVGWSEPEKRAYRIADNALTDASDWDAEKLRIEIGDLKALEFDLPLLGFSDAALDDILNPGMLPKQSLLDKFLAAPFSVLDARPGWWQDRKRAWLALGIQSELGRGNTAATGGSPEPLARARDGLPSPMNVGRKGFVGANTPHEGKGMSDGLVSLRAKEKAANATPGGSAMPAADYSKSGARGDGAGRAMRKRAANAEPTGGGGGGWKDHNEKQARNRRNLQAAAKRSGAFGQDMMRQEGDIPLARGHAAPSGSHARATNTQEWVKENIGEDGGLSSGQTGTSIFDPVLTELVYRWFCPPGGLILDPFAGGSVRGIVASRLDRKYTGIDLRPEQTEANESQAKIICKGHPRPRWVVGDSREIIPQMAASGAVFDLVMSCPPYGDLEVYSDDPRDLSAMPPADFIESYRQIVAASVDRLAQDRFAVFCVGDYRDPQGFYSDFISTTIDAFRRAGMRLYNSAILVTQAGSLPIRAGKQFEATRKLGTTHQHVVCFLKGDAKRATAACGPVEVGDVEDAAAEANQGQGEWGTRL